MRVRSSTFVIFATALAFLLTSRFAPRTASADPKKDIAAKMKSAMENYDLFDYEAARKDLTAALSIAKKSKVDDDALIAKVNLDLAIVYFAGLKDEDNAKAAFAAAAAADPTIQIDPAYRTDEMAKMLDAARGAAASAGGGEAVVADDVDCSSVKGLQHSIVDSGKANQAIGLSAYLGRDVKGASKVVLSFRSKGAADFIAIPMSKQGKCKYVASIPTRATKGDVVHYYINAQNDSGKILASKGSMGSPNIVELEGGAAKVSASDASADDSDNPLNGGTAAKPKNDGGDDAPKSDDNPLGGGDGSGSGSDAPPAKFSRVFFGVGIGTGMGYVTGKTEGVANTNVQCCFAPAPVQVMPELGFNISPTTSLAIMARLGFPIGANIDGHATLAPAAMLKLRHSFGTDRHGLHINGLLGAGVMRNVVKLSSPPIAGQDTDTVASGPMLLGVGTGYTANLGGPVDFVIDLNGIAGIPVVSTLGSAIVNFGFQFDLSLGLLVSF